MKAPHPEERDAGADSSPPPKLQKVMGTSETSVRSGSSPSSILTGEGELLERRERKNRILQIFLPCEPNARTGKKQRRCSLCAAAPCARAKQPNYATTLMHGHLALDCEALASSDDWEDRRLLLDLRRTCPSSLVKTDHQKQKGEAAAKPQDRDSQRQGAALSSHLPSISSSASPLAQAVREARELVGSEAREASTEQTAKASLPLAGGSAGSLPPPLVATTSTEPLSRRIQGLFVPHKPNPRTGKEQVRCSLCSGDAGTDAVQPSYAWPEMHAHLALSCKRLAASQDPADCHFLLELRRSCPRSLIRPDKQPLAMDALGVAVSEHTEGKELDKPEESGTASAEQQSVDACAASAVPRINSHPLQQDEAVLEAFVPFGAVLPSGGQQAQYSLCRAVIARGTAEEKQEHLPPRCPTLSNSHQAADRRPLSDLTRTLGLSFDMGLEVDMEPRAALGHQRHATQEEMVRTSSRGRVLRQAGRNDGNTVSWLNLGETKNLKAWKVLRGVRDRQTIMMGTRLSSSALAKGGGRGGGRPRGRGRGRDHTSGRTASSQLVNDLEVEIANAVGIHPFMFSVEEAIRIPPGVEASAYAKVRNHILAKWRANPKCWLDIDMAGEFIQGRYKHLVRLAWQFLTDFGFINFGVSQEITSHVTADDMLIAKHTIIIIGAGMAGLAAARQLLGMGHMVIVLEGRGTPGGRVQTAPLEGEVNGEVIASNADLGGSIITGTDGNQLAVVTEQLNVPLVAIDDETILYDENGQEVDRNEDEKVHSHFNNCMDQMDIVKSRLGPMASHLSLGQVLETLWRDSSSEVEGLKAAEALFQWHCANLEFANACRLNDISLTLWDQDDIYEMQGAHVFAMGGNGQLVEALAKGVPIMYNTEVNSISYSDECASVRAGDLELQADAVLVTVPLGVLKSGSITFQPALPQRKQEAIDRLGFGTLNKVVMLFPRVFWGSRDMFGRLVNSPSTRGLYYLFYSYAGISGGAQLTTLVAGEAAEEVEKQRDETVAAEVMKILRQIFPGAGAVPEPVKVVMTRWKQDRFCQGSYSSMAVGCHADEYQVMAESVGGRLFFAGEATNHKYPATMHGAFDSGLCRAAQIVEELDCSPRGRPVHATAGELTGKAKQLHALFRTKSPDVEFGMFAAMYAPPGSPFADQAVLRILIPLDGKPNQQNRCPRGEVEDIGCTPVYLKVQRKLLSELRNVRGGNAARMAAMRDRGLATALLRRTSVGDIDSRLLDAICTAHGML